MNTGASGLFRRQRRWPQPISSGLSGSDQSSSPVSVLECTAAFLGLLLAMVSLGWVNVVMADASDADKSMPSARVDTTQREFERLMAVARNTRQGTGSKVRRLAIEGRPAIGAKEAPLILVEIASFECPYCRRHWLIRCPRCGNGISTTVSYGMSSLMWSSTPCTCKRVWQPKRRTARTSREGMPSFETESIKIKRR